MSFFGFIHLRPPPKGLFPDMKTLMVCTRAQKGLLFNSFNTDSDSHVMTRILNYEFFIQHITIAFQNRISVRSLNDRLILLQITFDDYDQISSFLSI